MNRFSPEFTEKLRRKARQLGTREQFKRARDDFGMWVHSCQNMATLCPFGAHYNECSTMKPHFAISAQDRSTENYNGIECPLGTPCGEPDTLLRMEEAPMVRFRESPGQFPQLPPGRHMIPIFYRRPRTASEVLTENMEGRPPTVEEQAVVRARTMLELMAGHGVEIPRDQWPEWLVEDEDLAARRAGDV